MFERELGSKTKDAIMATGPQIYESGRLQGVQEGREQGREQGVREGRKLGVREGRKLGVREGRKLGVEEGHKRGVQRVLLRQRFGVAVGLEIERRIAAASLDTIEAWSERVLSAATLAEIVDG